MNSLDEAFKVNRKEIAAIKVVVEEQRTLINTFEARMVEVKNLLQERSASTATCCKRLLQLQKNLAGVLGNVKVVWAHAVVIAIERIAMISRCEDLRLSAEQQMDFADE